MKAFGVRCLLLLAACCVADRASSLEGAWNYTPYSVRFYEQLLSGRVWVFEENRAVMRVLVFGREGRLFPCFRNWAAPRNKQLRWSVIWGGSAATVRYENWGPKPRYAPFYYDPESGLANVEIFRADRAAWHRVARGWVQDTMPRSFAGTCPGLAKTAAVRINETQTSKTFDELRQQDPDAPVRNFPGSHLTAPGRTGLGASGGRPTTTKAEVEAFLTAQDGNVLINGKGIGLTWVRAGDREELWRIGNHYMADGYWDVVRTTDSAGEWIEIHDGPKVRRRYPIGYPFPYLPTGHRHPAFQITDAFLAHPRSLEFMGEAYADKRFVFHPEGKFSVVDEAGNLVEGPHFDGVWRWTKGHLEMTVRDDRSHSINWRELAVDPPPKMWSRFSRDVGGW